MKKLLPTLALAVVVVALAVVSFSVTTDNRPTTYPAHFLAKSPSIQFIPRAEASPLTTRQFEALLASVTTTTQGTSGRSTIITTSTGTEGVPTLATQGLALEGLEYIRVHMATSTGAATDGGKLEAFLWNGFTLAWDRFPAWDLTAIANTKQAWAPVTVGVRQGRAAWVVNGVGSVTTITHLMGQAR